MAVMRTPHVAGDAKAFQEAGAAIDRFFESGATDFCSRANKPNSRRVGRL
jgi:hypothetical protein